MIKCCRNCVYLTLDEHECDCKKDVNIFGGDMNFIPTNEIDTFYCAYHKFKEEKFISFKYIGGGSKGPTCAECGSSITLTGMNGTYCHNKDCTTNKPKPTKGTKKKINIRVLKQGTDYWGKHHEYEKWDSIDWYEGIRVNDVIEYDYSKTIPDYKGKEHFTYTILELGKITENTYNCINCEDWGCEECCSSKDEIRSRQGIYG